MSATSTARPFRAASRFVAFSFVVLTAAGLVLAWRQPPSAGSAQGDAQAPPPGAPDAQETGAFLSPRATLRAYLQAVRDGDLAAAAGHLDLSQVQVEPGSDAARTLARHLELVLRRKVWIDVGLVSDAPAGALDDGLDPELERVGTVPTKHGDVPVLLERGADGAWRVASYTVAAIPALYAEHGYGWIEDVLPQTLVDVRMLDLALWQWIGLLVAVLLASALGYAAGATIVAVVRALVRRTENKWDDRVLASASGPLRLALSILAFWLLSLLLALPVQAEVFVRIACEILAVVSVTWLVLRGVDFLALVVHDGMAESNANAANTLVPMGRRFTKLLVVAIAVVSLIHNLGFNAAGLLTGLGVGGLAVALAAQKTLENLFGGISVIADKPVEVGQLCRVGEHLGTVEEIGLRSSRLRTLDHTVVTIPNAEFSTVRIENYARREKMRIYTVLQVGYDTTPDQLRWLLAELRKLVYAHPRTLKDPCRVRFINFGAHSLDLEVFVYVDTRDFSEFLKIREDIYLRMIDVVAASGAYFAYPSQTLYLGRDGGRDLEKSAEAEQAVKGWRAERKLPFPDFSDEALAGLDGTLDYPPEGSFAPKEAPAAG